MENNIDKLLDELDGLEVVSPSNEFIEQLEKKAMSFTEMKIKYGKKMLILLLLLVASILIINALNIKYQNSINTEEQNIEKEYDLVPANTVDYE